MMFDNSIGNAHKCIGFEEISKDQTVDNKRANHEYSLNLGEIKECL